MIISCPKCSTRFIVPPAAIGKDGRVVKCSKCLHTWFQEAPEAEAEIVPEKVIEVPPVTNSPQSSEKNEPSEDEVKLSDEPLRKNVPALIKKRRTGVIFGWVLLAVLLIGGTLAALFLRGFLETNIPLAATLYEKWDQLNSSPGPEIVQELPPEIILVPHPASQLSMRQSAEVRPGGTAPTLVIFLDIQNNGNQDVELPEMTGLIRDAQGEEIFRWSQFLAPSIIPANGFQQYEIFVDTIQTRSRSVEISFTWPEEN